MQSVSLEFKLFYRLNPTLKKFHTKNAKYNKKLDKDTFIFIFISTGIIKNMFKKYVHLKIKNGWPKLYVVGITIYDYPLSIVRTVISYSTYMLRTPSSVDSLIRRLLSR